jgi:hypothetical protein
MSKECTTHHHACDCREEKFKQLEQENAALRELTSTLGAPNHINIPVEKWRELREDKERLDFLGQTKCAYYYEGPCCWRINEDKNTDGDTLRDAIDAARKEGP